MKLTKDDARPQKNGKTIVSRMDALLLMAAASTAALLTTVMTVTSLDATIPSLPAGPAVLLAWAESLNQIGILAILALVFLLAFRLRAQILFTPGSAWIVVACGAIFGVAGTVGQILDSIARSRLAEMLGANADAAGESYIFSADFNIGPLLVGIVLVLVAGVFQYGRRLQNDTEGLV